MTLKLAEITLWQQKVASLIRSGLLTRAEVIEVVGLFHIVGIYGDGTSSASLAKYGDRRRAEDALALLERLTGPDLPVDRN